MGILTEVGIEPTVHHGTDLGYVPVVVTDACSAGDEEAARHPVEVHKHAGDALFTDAATICARLRRPRGVEFTSRLGSRPGGSSPKARNRKDLGPGGARVSEKGHGPSRPKTAFPSRFSVSSDSWQKTDVFCRRLL